MQTVLRQLIDSPVIRSGNEDSRVRTFTISNERKDSHGTIIKLGGWDLSDFNRAGAFYYQHNTGNGFFNDANPDNALGPARAELGKGELLGIGEFEPADINPLAEKIMQKVDFGTMKMTSVGFTDYKGHWGTEKSNEDPSIFYFDTQRLIEFSVVHIGSNPDAVKKSIDEPMTNFLRTQIDTHESEGFKKDFNRRISRARKIYHFI